MNPLTDLYRDRYLSEGFPDIEKHGVAHHTQMHDEQPAGAMMIVDCIERLIDMRRGSRKVAVVGCGPRPRSLKQLLEMNYDAVGVEPVCGIRDSAREYLGNSERVLSGCAELLPFQDNSLRIVLMESVLEHVDSPSKSLDEIYRVLLPGGILYIYTTNRYKISITGKNGEFNVPFFNWFPSLVKESYVFQHLHYTPDLANYNPRPAVHWFSFSRLCALGRQAGFCQFYSLVDLATTESPWGRSNKLRKIFLPWVRRSPWLRALALTQAGGSIFMLKRNEPGAAPL